MKYVFVISLLLFSILSFSQIKHDYNWIYGYNSNDLPGSEGIEGFVLNFNEVPFNFLENDIGIELGKSNAVISDEDGNLLFYTNGCEIHNANFELMENGENLNPGIIHDIQCDYGYTAGNQSCLILPSPNSLSKFFLFHKHLTSTSFLWTDELLYSIIDVDANGGLGKILEKNIPVIQDSLSYGAMTAVKHENGEDWWVISGEKFNNRYYTFLLTENGIESPLTQSIGSNPDAAGDGGGAVVFSPDGKKFARYDAINHLFLYDFNRNTGQLSNFQQIIVDDTINVGGVAISSNSQFLYVTTAFELFQFDLLSEDIEASRVLIDQYDGFLDPFPTNFYQMQLAPDCRIFMNSTNGSGSLHVINYPNRKGIACDFQQHSIDLPAYHQISMPHFPYYRMDTDFPICDSSLFVTVQEVRLPKREVMEVFPNPVREVLTVRFDKVIREGELVILDILGREVRREKIAQQSKIRLDVNNLENGIYYLSFYDARKLRESQKISIIQ